MKTFFVVCFSLLTLFMQANPIVWDGKNKSLLIGQDILLLEEKDKALSIEDVTSGAYEQKFVVSDKKILDFGVSSSEYWVKISVENKTQEKLLLEVAQSLLSSVEFYFEDSSGKWQSYKAGYEVGPNQKVIHHHFQVFPLTGKGGNYYLHFRANGTPIPIRIWNDDVYETKITSQKITYGVYMGMMLFVILLNLFLFVSLRRITYLHYAALVFLFATFSAIFDGYITYLFPRMDLMFWYFLNPIINQPNGLLFCLLFLDAKKYVPRLHRFSMFVLIYFTSYIIWFNFLPASTALALNQLHALVGILLMATIGIRTGIKGNRLGYYYSLVYFIFFAIATIEVIYDRTGSPSYFFELSHVSIAIFMEVFMLAYLLSLRFKWEKSEIETAREEAQKQLIEKTLENDRIIREQNVVLEQKVEERTLALKETQQQLIQKEKLASLGQLTAGIAHEIKNPLNFINNFTDVTREMVGELIASDNPAEKTTLSNDIQQNLEKISFHGRRVDDIVKGMLLHSRAGSAEKEMTDINLLCDEAINLSFHSMKPQDADTVKRIVKLFATGLPLVPVVSSDISRVLLNLINNAVYAVRGNPDAKISVSTLQEGKSIVISVKDNGIGIPENIKSKIFQPFFTTKPAGDGTGLGLSISYDIVKAHAGEIKVNTPAEGGAEFSVVLPL